MCWMLCAAQTHTFAQPYIASLFHSPPPPLQRPANPEPPPTPPFSPATTARSTLSMPSLGSAAGPESGKGLEGEGTTSPATAAVTAPAQEAAPAAPPAPPPAHGLAAAADAAIGAVRLEHARTMQVGQPGLAWGGKTSKGLRERGPSSSTLTARNTVLLLLQHLHADCLRLTPLCRWPLTCCSSSTSPCPASPCPAFLRSMAL